MFALGMYDCLSVVLTQPYHGAKEEGDLGFVKGIGKGIVGVITKPGVDESVDFGLIGSNRARRVKKVWDWSLV